MTALDAAVNAERRYEMKAGDKVVPIGFVDKSRPGTVRMITSDSAIVTWKMGSRGWNWTVKHNLNELEKVE
ncbi:hypothetical protein [Paenibacillus odorifer]|uniref:hypothetical protein n=2 Tax=Paenibacillus TaxID=44249 RepID=UPI0015C2DEC4|nr:hypothetical protein [Paenibacillus odorifer]